MESTSADVAGLLREGIYWAHHQLSKKFHRNAARTPLPPPFEVRLASPAPALLGRPQPPTVHSIKCSNDALVDQAKVAIAKLAVPVGLMDAFALKESVRIDVTTDAEHAIRAAADAGCKAVLFPEHTLPRAAVPRFEQLAAELDIVVIGGLEGVFADGRLADEAIVCLPRARSVRQVKQWPSLEEQDAHSFHSDGRFNLFENSPVGDFAVVVCSDLMQLPTLQMWSPGGRLPEVVFVLTRNKHCLLFEPWRRLMP